MLQVLKQIHWFCFQLKRVRGSIGILALIILFYGVGFSTCTPPTDRSNFDFDHDCIADVAIVRPVGGSLTWWIKCSTGGPLCGVLGFGFSTDKPVPADYDGDGMTDIAIYRNGDWWFLTSMTSIPVTTFWSGDGNEIPQPCDYNGDGVAEIAYYRPNTGTWHMYNLVTHLPLPTISLGTPAALLTIPEKPVFGDYDADGRCDCALVHTEQSLVAPFPPPTYTWQIRMSNSGVVNNITWGGYWTPPTPPDIPVRADYDGDGKTDLAVYRKHGPFNPSDWWILNSGTNTVAVYTWGMEHMTPSMSDIPVPADYNATIQRANIAIFRPGTGAWWVAPIPPFATPYEFWGGIGDEPVPHIYVP